MDVKKIPPLRCPDPECNSIRVHLNTAKSIVCEDCGVKHTTFGNKLKNNETTPEWVKRQAAESRARAEKEQMKNEA